MRILLIEDDREIIKFLKPSLEADLLVVDIAQDGEDGSFLARTTDYDLIILANVLPKKTGLEVCKEIRKSGKSTPILILLVKSETTTKVQLLNAGADVFLSKPLALDELLATIKALLRRPKQLQGDLLKTDDLAIDTIRYTVTRGKKDIYLTPKEFMLLEYLLRNEGIVLSRGKIMEHVWDRTVDSFSHTINSHILRLRRKIDYPGKKKLIHTVPGRGYKIDIKKR